VVDDDDRLRALLKKFLHEQGFMVTVAADAAEACRKLRRFAFDLMILDVMMPGQSGVEMLSAQRADIAMPVIMLSAMGESDDRIRGLEVGAEDYVSKPFEPKELVLRIRALLRRSSAPQTRLRSVCFGEYRFDLATSQLRRGDMLIALTSAETAMLKLLADNAGKPVSREELAKQMQGLPNERAIDVQVTRLRKKIEESEGKPVYLQTVRGAGYVLYAQGVAT
jgi:two-component system phosphate regulon response regulator OmpR